MIDMQIEVTGGSERYPVTLILCCTNGKGLCGYLWGGIAHIGGVAYGVPRPKSNGTGLTADISSICGPGHKDVYAAQKVAQQLCVALNQPICICAGIHFDGIGSEQIQEILNSCLEVAQRAVKQYYALEETNYD